MQIKKWLHKIKEGHFWNQAVSVGLLFLVFVSGLNLSGKVVWQRLEREQARQERENLAQRVCRKVEPVQEEAGILEQMPDTVIDFEYLLSCNPDTVGWIQIPGTVIDYPIVQTKENHTYMSRDFYGTERPGGTIFLDYQSQIPAAQVHCVVYGHSMKDGSMFRDIARFQDPEYLQAHRVIYLYTPQKTILLEAVSCTWEVNSRELRRQCLAGEGAGTYVFVTCSYEADDVRTVLWAREVQVQQSEK